MCQTYTLVSLENEGFCNELVLLLYQEIGLQSDKDSCRSTFGFVYTLSSFLLFPQQQRKPFGLWVVPLAISSKILLCDNNGMVEWSKRIEVPLEEETHKEQVLPYRERVQGDDMTMEQNLSTVISLLLRLVGVCWD